MARGGVEWGWGLGTEVSLIWKLPSFSLGVSQKERNYSTVETCWNTLTRDSKICSASSLSFSISGNLELA